LPWTLDSPIELDEGLSWFGLGGDDRLSREALASLIS
jgi:hypothetical protein